LLKATDEACEDFKPKKAPKSILDLMSKEELRQQLDQQTNIIVEIENRSARLEELLRMALNLKRAYHHDVFAANKHVKELKERLEVRETLIKELQEVLVMREGLAREKRLEELVEGGKRDEDTGD
jgi:hypothetical protein